MKNAKDIVWGSTFGNLPQLSEAILGWFQPISFIRLVKTVVNAQVVEVKTTVPGFGMVQPLTPEQLLLKPEGQRSWKWQQIHALPDLILVVDEIITFQGTNYRVMAKIGWDQYGYVEYHMTEDYQ